MRTTQQLSITVPIEKAETIRPKVASGQYASESEVIRDGVRTLLARDQVVEVWLHGEVAQAYDALKRDLSRALTSEQIRARLAAEAKRLVI